MSDTRRFEERHGFHGPLRPHGGVGGSGPLDLKIEGATVIDGTGTAGGRTDLGIRDERIVAIGDLSREHAGSRLNASGRTVAPGFIDIHSHSDWVLWANRRAESKIRQGVTTEVVGNCGFSPVPVSDAFLSELRGFALHRPSALDFRWRSFKEYIGALDGGGLALNVVQLVGHGALRIAAMGFAQRAPDPRELARMQQALREAMDDGAWGLTSGLVYAPGSFAATDEIVALAKVAARHRGLYATHIRGEGATLCEAVSEAIAIGRDADLPVQISHLKAAGRRHWGKVVDALALIDASSRDGVDVTADVYPYAASSTPLATLVPDWALEGGVDAMLARLADPATRARIRAEIERPTRGEPIADRVGWENVLIAWSPTRTDAEGRRLSEIAAGRGLHPIDTALDLLLDESGHAAMILFQMDEADVRRVLVHPRTMVGSDGSALAPHGEAGGGKPHPRSYGTFPRVLGEYVREQRLLSLAQAVHKMTGLPARRLGLRDRGVIRIGAQADLVIFDPRRIADRATFEDPHRYPAAVDHVLVAGRFVIKDGQHTGSLPGRVLTPP